MAGRTAYRTTVDAVPMPPLDAWLYRQQAGGRACLTIGLLAWFEGEVPTVDELRERARHRLAALPRLCLKPVVPADPGGGHWPVWTTVDPVPVDEHVLGHPAGTAPDALVAHLLTDPLEPTRPPWQLHLIPVTGGFTLLLRAHHALLDGGSLHTVLSTLLDRDEGSARPHRPSATSWLRRLSWTVDDLLPKCRPMPLHGAVGPGRELAFRKVSAAELDAARDRLAPTRASRTAVFLAATGGALYRLGLAGASALVPVDVRTPAQAALLGNHYATTRIPLSAHPDPVARLAVLHDRVSRGALHQRATAQAALVARRPRRFTAVSRAVGTYVDSPWYFSLLCTSIASPHAGQTLGAARLAALAGTPPLSPGHPLAVTMVHHHGGAVLTTVTDQRRHQLTVLSDLIHEEITRMAGR